MVWAKRLKLDQFVDTISRDQIKDVKKKGYYIINLDYSLGNGTHWVAMKLGDNLEYFDSFGITIPPEIIKFCKKVGISITYSSGQYQCTHSPLCGYYCL